MVGAEVLSRAGLTGLVALDAAEARFKAAALLADPFVRAAWRLRIAEEPARWRGVLAGGADSGGSAAEDAASVAALVIASKRERERTEAAAAAASHDRGSANVVGLFA